MTHTLARAPASVLTHQRDTSTPKASEAEMKEKKKHLDSQHEYFHPHTQDCSESSHAHHVSHSQSVSALKKILINDCNV